MSKIVEKSKTNNHVRKQTNLSEEAILEAAERLFQEFGFSKVTMDEITDEAGMGKASLYYYFPTKEQLFSAVIGSRQRQFIVEIEAIIAGNGSASEKLRHYIDHRFRYFSTMLSFRFMEIDPSLKRKPVMADILSRFRNEELGLLRRIFRQGREQGEFQAERIDAMAELFLHIFHGLRIRYMFVMPRPDPKDPNALAALREEVTMAAAIFLRGIGHNHRRAT